MGAIARRAAGTNEDDRGPGYGKTRAGQRTPEFQLGSLPMPRASVDALPFPVNGVCGEERDESVHRGKRRVSVLLAVLFLLLAWGRARHLQWLAHSPGDHAAAILGNALLLGAYAYVAAMATMRAALGFPRLIVTRQGLTRRSLFRTTTAGWNSLSRFHVEHPNGGKTVRATADIIGPNAGSRLRRRKDRLFKIDNSYRTSVEMIVAEIHDRQTEALGAPAPLPRAASTPVVPEYGIAGFRLPWATFGLLAILIAAFVAEHRLGVGPEGAPLKPNALTLYAFGGLSRDALFNHGELLRLFSSALLHFSREHLVGNAAALLLVGWPLERFAGRSWLLGVFMASSVAGSAASLAAYPANTTLVGASSGITGLSAAMVALSLRLPNGRKRKFMIVRATLVLVLAFIPSEARGSVQIGYVAHLGGALAGAVLGSLLLSKWRESCRLPRFRRAGLAVGAGGLALALLGIPVSLRLSREFVVLEQGCTGGDPDATIQSCTAMLGLRPASAGAYNNRAWALHLKGEDAIALPDAEKAVSLAPRSAPALETRAEIYEKLGRGPDAEADYRAALAIDGGLQLARDGLTRLSADLQTSR